LLESIDRIQRPSKLTETIATKLHLLIKEGRLKPGDRLPSEKDLCVAFGVGRSSIREALQALEYSGMVQTRQGIGRFLTKDSFSYPEPANWGQVFDQFPVFELMEARQYLEVVVARLAAQRASEEAIAEMESILKDIKQGAEDDADQFFVAELRFHQTLSRASGNRVLAELVRLVIRRVHGEAERFLRTVPHVARETATLCEGLLMAIADGNSERAGEIMGVHLNSIGDVLRKHSSSEDRYIRDR
jgi:GntR family transcriptional repressor for pyruvate dehydrogenase complex